MSEKAFRYSTLLFDADDTIFDFKSSEKAALRLVLADFNLPFTDEIHARYHRINDELWKDFEKGVYKNNLPRHMRFEKLLDFLGEVRDANAMNDVYTLHLGKQSKMIDGAFEVCRTLARTHKLYIITNGTASVQHSRFDSSEVRVFFDDMFISSEIGSRKPEAEFFDAVFSKIENPEPARTLIIGDSLSSDISGGINYGVDTCWFNPGNAPCPESISPSYEIKSLEELYAIV